MNYSSKDDLLGGSGSEGGVGGGVVVMNGNSSSSSSSSIGGSGSNVSSSGIANNSIGSSNGSGGSSIKLSSFKKNPNPLSPLLDPLSLLITTPSFKKSSKHGSSKGNDPKKFSMYIKSDIFLEISQYIPVMCDFMKEVEVVVKIKNNNTTLKNAVQIVRRYFMC